MAYAGSGQDERIAVGATVQRNGTLGVEADTTAGASTYDERDNQGTLVSEHTPAGDFYFAFDSIGSAIGVVDATGVQRAAYSYGPTGAKKRHPLLGSVELVGGSFTLVFAAIVGVATCREVVFRADGGERIWSGYRHDRHQCSQSRRLRLPGPAW